MNDLFTAALEFQEFFEKQNWEFCFIGGLAYIRWGSPRMTQDVDISLFTGFGNEENMIDVLLESFDSRLMDAKSFALSNRVLLLFSSKNVKVDIALAALPFEKQMMHRASKYEFAFDCVLLTCSAEDLVIQKAFADRNQDWADVENVIDKQSDKLNKTYIFKQIEPLSKIKETPEIVTRLELFFQKQNNFS